MTNSPPEMLELPRGEGCLSDLTLDRLLAGELEGPARVEVDGHLEGCSACTERLATLRLAAESFPSEVFVPALAASTLRRARPARATALLAALGTVAAAAVVLLTVLPPAQPPEVRSKGPDRLELFVRRASGSVEAVLPGGALTPGDAVRLRIASTKGGYLVVLGIDAAGAITPYAPTDGTPQLFQPGEHLLEGSIILDATLGPERIMALLCAEPVSVGTAASAARAALEQARGDPEAVDRLTVGCTQTSFLIEKVAP